MQESLKAAFSVPSSPGTTTATFADDTAVLAIDPNAVAASKNYKPASTPFITGFPMETESNWT
jgi:hypothetical protein